MKKYFLAGATIVLLLAGLYVGYLLFSPAKEVSPRVNATTILTLLQKEGFLVTQTSIFNQTIAINKSTGSQWKDIFWRQYIEAAANMKVSLGIDLTKLRQESIQVSARDVVITLPEVEQHSNELVGAIILKNSQGILKKLFDNDDGYNVALAQLKEEANRAAADSAIREQAKQNAVSEIGRLLAYVEPNKKITVRFAE